MLLYYYSVVLRSYDRRVLLVRALAHARTSVDRCSNERSKLNPMFSGQRTYSSLGHKPYVHRLVNIVFVMGRTLFCVSSQGSLLPTFAGGGLLIRGVLVSVGMSGSRSTEAAAV